MKQHNELPNILNESIDLLVLSGSYCIAIRESGKIILPKANTKLEDKINKSISTLKTGAQQLNEQTIPAVQSALVKFESFLPGIAVESNKTGANAFLQWYGNVQFSEKSEQLYKILGEFKAKDFYEYGTESGISLASISTKLKEVEMSFNKSLEFLKAENGVFIEGVGLYNTILEDIEIAIDKLNKDEQQIVDKLKKKHSKIHELSEEVVELSTAADYTLIGLAFPAVQIFVVGAEIGLRAKIQTLNDEIDDLNSEVASLKDEQKKDNLSLNVIAAVQIQIEKLKKGAVNLESKLSGFITSFGMFNDRVMDLANDISNLGVAPYLKMESYINEIQSEYASDPKSIPATKQNNIKAYVKKIFYSIGSASSLVTDINDLVSTLETQLGYYNTQINNTNKTSKEDSGS